MNFRTVDELEHFGFDDVHVSEVEYRPGHFCATLDNVMISPQNTCNRDVREMRTNALELRLQDADMVSFVKEGVKVFNADGLLQRQEDDVIISESDYKKYFELLVDSYIYRIVKENDIYNISIEQEEYTYQLQVRASHDVEQWDRFMNKEVM